MVLRFRRNYQHLQPGWALTGLKKTEDERRFQGWSPRRNNAVASEMMRMCLGRGGNQPGQGRGLTSDAGGEV